MNSLRIKSFFFASFVIAGIFLVPQVTEAAARFWVGGTGNWSDNTNHWSATSGGAPGASKPTTGDTVTLDASSGGGTITADESIVADSITMGAFTGTLDTNGQTVTLQSFSITGTGARTLTLGSSAVNLSLAGTCWNATTVTNLTITTNTAVVTCSGAGATFTSATQNYNGMSLALTGSGTATIGTGSITLANLNRTGTAVKTDILSLSGNITVTGTLTLAGNSTTNRLLVQSNTLGTPRTVTNTGATMAWSNVDLKDISLGTAYDCSLITGLCGDSLGNTNITFTTGQTQYWTGESGSWSSATQWCTTSGGCADNAGDGRVPLPQDDIVFDNGSFSTTARSPLMDMPRAGKNIDWSAYNEGQAPVWNTNQMSSTIYGSITMVPGMSTVGGTSVYMEGRSGVTLNTEGITWASQILSQTFGSSLTLLGDLTQTATLLLNTGTLNANNFNLTLNAFNASNCSSSACVINMGSGIWTLTIGNATVWNTNANVTINADTSTIVINDTSTSAKTFTGSSKTYNNITFSGDNITVTGNNTFNTLAVNNAGLANGLKLNSGSTQTISNLTTNGSAGNLAILAASPSGIATLSKSSGTVSVDYMSIASSTATGGAVWYAGANSTNVGNNTGWTFSDPGSLPTVTVQAPSSVTNFTATLNGNITDTGGANPTLRGFEYGTTTSYGLATTTSGSYSTGAFSMIIENLLCNTTYHVRATTTNSVGGGVSSDTTFTTSACPTNWYVSPSGSSSNNGSINYPWSMGWALIGASTTAQVIQPGDTVYLRGGTYNLATTTGEYQYDITLSGSVTSPITFKSYNGEWAIFDGNLNGVATKNNTLFDISGDYLWFRDFEITNSEVVTRKIADSSSNPSTRRANSIDDRGTGNKIINLVIHDTGQGIGAWGNGEKGEYYGNIIYNNGWDAPDRLHGHGIYTQNDTGWKRYINNIWLNPFGNNISMYGSGSSDLNNQYWEGNHMINGKVLFGGQTPMNNLKIYKNFFDLNNPEIGYDHNGNDGIIFRKNYVASSTLTMSLSKNVIVDYNTIIKQSTTASSNYLVSITLNQASPVSLTDYTINHNTYYKPTGGYPYVQFYSPTASVTGNSCNYFWFNTSSQGYGYCSGQPASWQDNLGYDLNSTLTTSAVSIDAIFYRKNKYDDNRMNVYAYNWDGDSTVSIDPSLVLDNGDSYEIHNTQDYFDDVITGTYSGSPISITMTAGTRTLEKPIGYDEVVSGGGWYHDPLQATTFPTLGAFVIVNTSGTTDDNGPVISNILNKDVGTSTATIWWDTDEDSTTVLNYGLTTSYGTASTTDDGTIYGTFYTTTHEISLRDLTPGTTYHYRLTSVDYQGNSVSSSDQTFTTDPVAQTITTSVASYITSTSATLNGSIDSTGGANATEHGFAWGTDSGLTSAATTTEGSFSGTGSVSSSVSSLTCNTTYYFRGYSTNSVGTSYGSIESLTTSACPLPSESSSSSSGGSSSGGRRRVIVENATTSTPVISQIIQNLPIIETNKPTSTVVPIPPEEPSLSLSSGWNLFSSEAVSKFALSPLPKKLVELAEKFPKLADTFEKLGIKTISDLDKLNNVSFSLPKVENEFPTNVVLIKGAGDKIDIGSSIVIDNEGSLEQKVKLVSNTKVTLMVKPDATASRVSGYLLFKKSTLNPVAQIPGSSEAALSIFPILVAHAAEIPPPKPEMLVQSFSYTDPEGDGIYTAEIQTPASEGIYEVVTLISYMDKDLGAKELRLTTVVDPEGYVFEILDGKEARIGGAKVSLYNTEGNTLWNAVDYSQDNPQRTDKSGRYAFLVPEGKYYITAEMSDYKFYKSIPFEVKNGEPVHFNIEMEAVWNIKKIFDWKFITILVLLIFIGLFKFRKR